MAKQQKVPVTLRAVNQRINRRLAAENQVLKAMRGERARQTMGDYIVVDDRNRILHHDVDPEALARELGALADWEEVVS
jgi:hypothetical protein